VAEHRPQFVVVELLHGGRADHDERLVHADRRAVDDRLLGHVQLWWLGDVEGCGRLGEALIDPRVLAVVDADRGAAGVVLDVQTALLRESAVPPAIQAVVEIKEESRVTRNYRE